MLRLVGCRLGGRLGRRSTKTVIDAAVNAVLAELGVKLTKAKKVKRVSAPKPPPAVEAPPAIRAEQLIAPPTVASSPPAAKAVPAKTKVTHTKNEPVDVVLSSVNCTMLKHVLSSSSSSSTLTDIPDMARMLRLDYTIISSQHQLAHLADILLVNRIHAAVIADTMDSEAGEHPDAAAAPSSPLVVLVETSLPREDAEVQQFIIRNALHMHPLPSEVATNDGQSLKTPALTVLVLDDERTTRVRALAGLPTLPPRAPTTKAVAKPSKTSTNESTLAVNAATTSTPATAGASTSKKPDHDAKRRHPPAPAQDAPQRTDILDGEGALAPQETDAHVTAEVENVLKSLVHHRPSSGVPAAAPAAATADADADEVSVTDAGNAAAAAAAAADTGAGAGAGDAVSDAVDADASNAAPAAVAPGPAAASAEPTSTPVPTSVSDTQLDSIGVARPLEKVEAPLGKDSSSKRPYNVARIPAESFILHKKTRKPATATRFLLLESIADAIAGKGVAAVRPPRVLSVDSPHEKLMWASRPGRPLSIEVLEPLVSPDVYANIRTAAKANATASSPASPLTMHVVVYSVGNEINASRVWIGALQAASDLASALSGGASQLAVELTELVGLDSWRVRRIIKRRIRRRNEREEAVANSFSSIDSVTSAHIITAASTYPIPPRPHVYVLIHTRLSNEDAAVFKQELDYYLTQLKETPAGSELAGLSVLTADDASPTRLSYVLDHSMVEEDSNSVDDSQAQRASKPLVVPPIEKMIPVKKTEVRRIFDEVYRLLSEERWLYRLPLPPDALASSSSQQQETPSPSVQQEEASPSSSAQQQEVPPSSAQQQEAPPSSSSQQETPSPSVQQEEASPSSSAQQQEASPSSSSSQQQETPSPPRKEKGTFPYRKQWPHAHAPSTEALRVAVLTQILLQHKEAQLRKHFEAAVKLKETTTDSQVPTTESQRLDMKTVVTEAVEEVSARHEQATAHLVKTLSAAVEQWSVEKLSDTLEVLVKNQVKPIMETLEERLSSSPASASVAGSTDVAPLVTSEEHNDLSSMMSQVLAQLRELNDRTSASSAVAHPLQTAVAKPQSEEEEEEVRLLRDLHKLQEQHHSKLNEEMANLRTELHSLASQERPAAEAREPPSSSASMAALSPESLDRAVADTTHEVTSAIRQGIHSSIVQHLDTYCDVHRNAQGSVREDGSGGEPSAPVLPVTSFELEEMLARVVDNAVRESTNQVRGHVQAAMEKALRNELAASPASLTVAASTKSATEPDEALKAALEGLWAQVRAEAAEVEAAKLSQHNHQLLRLFRRHHHLQRSAAGGRPTTELASVTLPATSLSYVALEEAMRTVMHPYMMQMQATVASAAASAKVNASSTHNIPV
ncbi:hypothetical protein JKF63_05816 [Porcisia hertigi]|uniref:Uncharacterized protein n=1 Tax=Porcisia hertigi TaxID=2761500 RepID=A0A836IX62_9TRYP|nr:hypothetical protein JKF63_05816 [Porcisia hertigi]